MENIDLLLVQLERIEANIKFTEAKEDRLKKDPSPQNVRTVEILEKKCLELKERIYSYDLSSEIYGLKKKLPYYLVFLQFRRLGLV